VVQLSTTRKYLLEEKGIYLPSVTTVLSMISKPGIDKWRKRVGEEAADRKCLHASTRGTRLHTVHEYYLNNIDVSTLKEYQVPLIKLMFSGSRSKLDQHVDVIYQQETQMFSERLGVAGTVDLICEFDGELAGQCSLRRLVSFPRSSSSSSSLRQVKFRLLNAPTLCTI
jgi:hypothetical protein